MSNKPGQLARYVLLPLLVASANLSADELPPLDCVIEPHMVVDLSSQIDGIVEILNVDRGDVVATGQSLVKLESSVEEAAVKSARARATATAQLRSGEVSAGFAERRKERVQSLYKDNIISPDQMDETETQKKLSNFQLQQAKENNRIARLELNQAVATLERHTIASPIDGVVVQRYLAPGESVKDKPIMRLAQIDPLRVEVIVPVSRFGEIEPGQTAVVRPEAPKEGEFEATVAVVDRVADAASGTFRVRLTLPNPNHDLPSGLRCQVQISPELKPAKPAPRVASAEVVPPEKTAQVVKTAAKKPVRAQSCRMVGPIKDAQQARQIRAALSPNVQKAELSEVRAAKTSGFSIVTAKQATPADARKLADELKAAGFADQYIYKKGKYAGRVSLGYYRDEKGVRELVKKIESAGFQVEVRPEGHESAEFWVNVTVADSTDALAKMQNVLLPLAPAVEAKEVSCKRMMAVAKN